MSPSNSGPVGENAARADLTPFTAPCLLTRRNVKTDGAWTWVNDATAKRRDDVGVVIAGTEQAPSTSTSATGAGTQTFTNSPCSGLTTERWVPVTVPGQTGTWYMPACQ